MSMVGTFIVPRDTQARLAALVARIVLPAFRRGARLFRTYEAKDDFLAFQAPWFLLTLLATWLGLLITGFALMLWAFSPLDIASAFREAGSSLLTLGFATSRGPGPTALDLLAAASGLDRRRAADRLPPGAVRRVQPPRDDSSRCSRAGPVRRRGGRRSSGATSASARSTPSRRSTRIGRAGQPTSLRVTRRIRSCCSSVHPTRCGRGSPACSP